MFYCIIAENTEVKMLESCNNSTQSLTNSNLNNSEYLFVKHIGLLEYSNIYFSYF